MTGLSVLGVVITAAFFLMLIQRVFLGELNIQWRGLPDMDFGELVAIVPLALITVAIGVYPAPLINFINVSTSALLGSLGHAVDLASVFGPWG